MAKRKRKGNPKRQMPPALKRYWQARNRRLRNPKRKTGRSRQRRSNPVHVLFAQRPGGQVLKYLGGIKFARTGRTAKFDSKAAAASVGRQLKAQFKVLRPYRVWAI